jgi:hypothetical protein
MRHRVAHCAPTLQKHYDTASDVGELCGIHRCGDGHAVLVTQPGEIEGRTNEDIE